jgi:hypothetical protein
MKLACFGRECLPETNIHQKLFYLFKHADELTIAEFDELVTRLK